MSEEKDPCLDDTKELITHIESDTVNLARSEVRKRLQMLREASALTSTDLLEENARPIPPDRP